MHVRTIKQSIKFIYLLLMFSVNIILFNFSTIQYLRRILFCLVTTLINTMNHNSFKIFFTNTTDYEILLYIIYTRRSTHKIICYFINLFIFLNKNEIKFMIICTIKLQYIFNCKNCTSFCL